MDSRFVHVYELREQPELIKQNNKYARFYSIKSKIHRWSLNMADGVIQVLEFVK
jgi:hypothetical protein